MKDSLKDQRAAEANMYKEGVGLQQARDTRTNAEFTRLMDVLGLGANAAEAQAGRAQRTGEANLQADTQRDRMRSSERIVDTQAASSQVDKLIANLLPDAQQRNAELPSAQEYIDKNKLTPAEVTEINRAVQLANGDMKKLSPGVKETLERVGLRPTQLFAPVAGLPGATGNWTVFRLSESGVKSAASMHAIDALSGQRHKPATPGWRPGDLNIDPNTPQPTERIKFTRIDQ
jgi:hypothetical protein